MKWKSLRQVNCFQLCRESNEKWSLYYICMLKGNYWFQICNNEISLLMGYKIKLYENKSNKCAFSHIRRNAILQAARAFCFQAFVHILPINDVKNPSICMSDQGPLASLSPGESSWTFSSSSASLMSPSRTEASFPHSSRAGFEIWFQELRDWV